MCEHKNLRTWSFEDGEPAGLCSCADCGIKFIPMPQSELRDCYIDADGCIAEFNATTGEYHLINCAIISREKLMKYEKMVMVIREQPGEIEP